MTNIPQWSANGDWFDVCKCNIACPCEFAQPPTFDECNGILAWHKWNRSGQSSKHIPFSWSGPD